MDVDKVLRGGCPGRELYVWHVWVDGGEDGGVCVELGDGFVGGPGKEASHGVWVLVWLPGGAYDRGEGVDVGDAGHVCVVRDVCESVCDVVRGRGGVVHHVEVEVSLFEAVL